MKTFITGLGILIFNSLFGQLEIEYLNRVLKNINNINAASYIRTFTTNIPGDSLAFSTYKDFVQMYVNQKDSFVGSSYSTSSIDNYKEFKMCYDGTYDVRFNWDKRNVEIDTLTNIPYRRPISPFFIKVKTLINYALDNKDRTIISYTDFQDSIKISFFFKREIIQFLWLNPNISPIEGKSYHELWVDKNYLPYKLLSEVEAQKTWEVCSDIKVFNKLDSDFDAIKQIPEDFTIRGIKREIFIKPEIEGSVAGDWKLKEINGDTISLTDLKSKVILIQFTGIGCGHCHESIPFLKQLAIENKDKDFELIGIEIWSKNISVVEKYKGINELNFRLLASNDEIKDKYKIQGVPAFYILDDKRVIKKVIIGYQKGETEKEITNTINNLL